MNSTYDKNNIFAKIINKEVKSKIFYEDEKILVFEDAFPAAPIHLLIIPKKPYISYMDFLTNADDKEIVYFFKKIKEIAKMAKTEDGFRLITNNGAKASQTVMHFHMHLIAGKPLGGLLASDILNR